MGQGESHRRRKENEEEKKRKEAEEEKKRKEAEEEKKSRDRPLFTDSPLDSTEILPSPPRKKAEEEMKRTSDGNESTTSSVSFKSDDSKDQPINFKRQTLSRVKKENEELRRENKRVKKENEELRLKLKRFEEKSRELPLKGRNSPPLDRPLFTDSPLDSTESCSPSILSKEAEGVNLNLMRSDFSSSSEEEEDVAADDVDSDSNHSFDRDINF